MKPFNLIHVGLFVLLVILVGTACLLFSSCSTVSESSARSLAAGDAPVGEVRWVRESSMTPVDKAALEIGIAIVKSGTFDPDAFATVVERYLAGHGGAVSEAQREVLQGLLAGLKNGTLSQAEFLQLASHAAVRHAAADGVDARTAASLLALAHLMGEKI